MNQKQMLLICSSVAAIAVAATPARADEPTTVGELEVIGARADTLEVKTIAGSRLGLTGLETPASVELLTGDVIRERGDLSVQEAVSRAAGVTSIGTPGDGGAALSARGFAGLGSVMQLYDGMRLYVASGTITFPFDPWTVDRVEVLRGPASVMFGEGAIGGAVNVVPKPPSQMREVDYQVGVGSFGAWRVGVGAGGPLDDALSYRLDASYNQSEGYGRRGDSDSLAVSGALRWQATPTLAFTLRDDYGDQNPQPYFGAPLIDGVLRKETLKLNYNVADADLRYRDNWLQLKTEWTPSASLTVRNDLYSLTSDRRWRNAETYNWLSGSTLERTDYVAIGHEQDQTGDRLEVLHSGAIAGLANTFAFGAEVNHIEFTHSNNGYVGDDLIDAFNPVAGSFFDNSVAARPAFTTDTDQYAIFAEDRLALTSKFSLSAGARYDHSRYERTNLLTGASFGGTFRHTDWRVGAVYQPNPGLSLYAQYATGSDPLGSLVTTSQSQVDFKLATAEQYEVGIKQVFAGGRGQWTLAAYDIAKKNLLSQRTPSSPVEQVGERSARGLEAALTLKPTPAWTIEANAAVLDARFDQFIDSDGVSLRGATPANIPEKTANLWVGWRFAPAFEARAGLRYVGETYSDDANRFRLPSYTVADLGLDWDVRANTTLTVRVTNVANEIYPVTAYGDEQWILGRPRAVEVSLRGRF